MVPIGTLAFQEIRWKRDWKNKYERLFCFTEKTNKENMEQVRLGRVLEKLN